MKISPKGLDLIKEFEGLRLKPYDDGGGVYTIGYGHIKGVTKYSAPITKEVAERYLKKDIAWSEEAINKHVKVPLNQNQFDALVSFVFNIGAEAFKNSTLLRKLNDNHYMEASFQFLRWNKDNGKIVAGLTKRRQRERDLFLTKEN